MSDQSLFTRLQALLDPLPTAAQPTVGHAAVLLALTDELEPRLWLIRRSQHLLIHPGQIAFPGGKGEAHDHNLLATALREAEEEVALPRVLVAACGGLGVRQTLTGYGVSCFVGVVPADLVLTAEPNEVAELIALPLSAFAHAGNLHGDRIWRAGKKRRLPRYQVGSVMVWGMTASFIVELVNRFYDADFDQALYGSAQAFDGRE